MIRAKRLAKKLDAIEKEINSIEIGTQGCLLYTSYVRYLLLGFWRFSALQSQSRNLKARMKKKEFSCPIFPFFFHDILIWIKRGK